ncbi:MAG: hypothetical protein MZV64_44830 [Ignavibacteriales bacterium]|nr:hypothetical protein [Ignavibacteriales bacterium]
MAQAVARGDRALPAGRRAELSGDDASRRRTTMHDQWTGPELDSLLGTALADAPRDDDDVARAVGFARGSAARACRHGHHDQRRGPRRPAR